MIQWIRSWRHNWGAKVLALLAAIGLWFFVMKEQNPMVDVTYTVQLHTTGLAEQYMVEDIPKDVKVRLVGPRNAILTLDPTSLKAYVDLSDVHLGQQNVDVRFSAPSGVRVEEISPANLLVTIDEYAVREMPVEIQQMGKLSDDTALKSMTTVPKVVSISGPKSVLKQIARVVLRVTMNERTESFTSSGMLIALDGQGREVKNVTLTPRQGQAQIELERIRLEKIVPVDASYSGSLAEGLRVQGVQIEPAEVLASGKEGDLKDLTAIKTIAIPLAGVQGTFSGDFNLAPVDGVTVKPDRVHVTVQIEKQGN